jgi:nicotinamide-nucleotide amidase
MHPGALETLKERFARFGSQMTENNLQQAMIPTGAILIENPVGTAPGFIVECEEAGIGGSTVIALPGVPREMKHLMTETVLPYIRGRLHNQGIIRRRVLRTVGIGESAIDDRLSELMLWANPTVGLAAHTAQCDVRITARAGTIAEADSMLDALESVVRERIGDFIYSDIPEEPLGAVVGRMMQQSSLSLALWESNTQGDVARRLSDTLSPELLRAQTPHAAPVNPDGYSETMAAGAAVALRQQSGTRYALAILGTQGATEGVYGTTSGRTWIGLATPERSFAVQVPFGGMDDYTVTLIGNNALRLLWQELRRQ